VTMVIIQHSTFVFKYQFPIICHLKRS